MHRYIFVLAKTLSIALLFTITQSLYAVTLTSDPRLTASPGIESFDGGEQLTDWEDLFTLAFIVSGAPAKEPVHEQSFTKSVAELQTITETMDERKKAEKVLEFMHQRFFNKYDVKQTRFDILLETGDYNCVSSAVMYAILGTSVGLDVQGVGTIDHAFCTVSAGGESVDVETTNLYGFDPGTKTEFLDAFGETTGYVYTPQKNYRDRRTLDLLNLFSIVLSNKASDAESDRNFTEAVGFAVDRWTLLGKPSGQVYDDLVDRMINYGVEISRSGGEQDALDWADKAVSVFGPHPQWSSFVDSVGNNLLVGLIRSKNISEARTSFERLKHRFSSAVVSNLELVITEAEIIEALNAVEPGGDDGEFFALLNKVSETGVLPPARIREFTDSRLLSDIDYISRTAGWESAFWAANDAVELYGSSSKLKNVQRIAKKNWVAGMYNEAVSLYNSERYDEAQRLIDDALEIFPDERLLLNLQRKIAQ